MYAVNPHTLTIEKIKLTKKFVEGAPVFENESGDQFFADKNSPLLFKTKREAEGKLRGELVSQLDGDIRILSKQIEVLKNKFRKLIDIW